MKVYVRQIKPYHYSPPCQGFNAVYKSVIDMWYDEDDEEYLREICEPQIKHSDIWGSLKFEERFVPIEYNIVRIKEDDDIIITVDPDLICLDAVEKVIKKIRQTFNNAMIVKFKGMDIEIKYKKEEVKYENT